MGHKQAHLNKIQIDKIVNELKGIRHTCKDPALLKKIDAMCKMIDGLPGVDSKEVVYIDVQILNQLSKLRMAVQNGDTNLTEQLFRSIEAKLAKHAEICYKSVDYPLTKKDRRLHRKLMKQNRKEEEKLARELKKNGMTNDEIDEEISALQDENKKLQQECAKLFDELQAGYDRLKDAQLKEKDSKIKSNERKIDTYLSARNRRKMIEMFEKEKEIGEEVGKGTPTMEELKVAAETAQAQQKKRQRDDEELENVMRNLETESGTTVSTPASSATTVAPVSHVTPVAPATPVQTNVVQNPYVGMRNPYTTSSTPQYGKVSDYFEDVDEQVGLLKGTIKEIEREIGKKDGELREISEEIKKLLLQRREASAAECVSLDGTIDSKYSAYSTAKLGIERLNQERAKYSMDLNIVTQIRDIRDAAERDERIAEMSGGRFLDIAALATAVNDATARKNEIIAEARDAVAVANATPIDGRTFAETGVLYDTGVKDEEKYAGMEREFGLRV